ncbi:SRPBCC family protein [Pedobacter frigoris]|uniref:SRPBCC domain-containing protein n=1 Tax=Pedobacter frigoris TaxID=2571272 RepID=A0A4U1CDW1_9SPHI|nr:SRPBCC domain-containing protein [Pedobacter frigoris]TKC04404.1 SRPBCC domain-containing protein [Pedobacter frigoris]
MERLTFNITIDAPREKVWKLLWSDESYREWTSAFSEGSRAETDWKEGSKVLFLGEGEDGMVSRIVRNIPNEFMSIEHLGMIQNGVEDLDSDAVKGWSGALENYTLKDVDGKTELFIETDMDESYVEQFKQMWPKALDKLKTMAEK